MGVAHALEALVAEIADAGGPHERLQAILERPSPVPPVPPARRDAATRVEGCTTPVWIEGWVDGGALRLAASADGALVEALVRLQCEPCLGATPADVRVADLDLLGRLGLERRISPTRQRGLAAVRERLRALAAAGPPLLDAHCHLPADGADLDPGVTRAVVDGTRPEDWDDVLALAARDPRVIPALGLHPWHVDAAPEGWEARLRALLLAHPAAQVGEIGLDRTPRAAADAERQAAALRAQLALAAELGRSATIHCVRAWGALLAALDDAPRPRTVVVHRFGGSAETAAELRRRGVLLSRATWEGDAPDDALVETDAAGSDATLLGAARASLGARAEGLEERFARTFGA